MPVFPNVPNVPGVPSLPRNPLASVPGLLALTRDALAFFAGLIGPRWGLFYNGRPVIDADSVLSFDYKQSWNVANYPLERGAFETYDKVEVPFDVRMRFASGGSEANRAALLASVEAVAGGLLLLDAVTPERVYTGVNINHYDYRQMATNGVGLMVVDVWCIQVRVTATTAFAPATTQAPAGAGVVQGGVVQPVPVPAGTYPAPN